MCRELSHFISGNGGDHLEAFQCVIGDGILEDPVRTPCLHAFCSACISTALDHNAVCPICRAPVQLSQLQKDFILEGFLSNLKTTCDNQSAGCDWIGKWSELMPHMHNECDFQEISCQFANCMHRCPRSAMLAHEEQCIHRSIPCSSCHQNVKFGEQEQHLGTECAASEVTCPNGCGVALTRSNLAAHLKDSCPDALIACPFSSFGCEIGPLKRSALQDHHNAAQCLHMELICKQVSSLSERLPSGSSASLSSLLSSAPSSSSSSSSSDFLTANTSFASCATLRGHTGAIYSLASNSQYLFSGSADATIKMWPIHGHRRFEAHRTFTGHSGPIWSICAMEPASSASDPSQSHRIASGSADCSVKIWSNLTGQPLQSLSGHTQAVYSVQFDGITNRLYSSSADGRIIAWDGQVGTSLATIPVAGGSGGSASSSGSVWSLFMNTAAVPNQMISGSEDGIIRIWDLRDLGHGPVSILQGHTAAVYASPFVPGSSGHHIYSGSRDKTLIEWDLRRTTSASGAASSSSSASPLVRTMRTHTNSIYGVFATRSRVFAASADTTVSVWGTSPSASSSSDPSTLISAHSQAVYSVCVQDSYLFTSSHDKSVKVWQPVL